MATNPPSGDGHRNGAVKNRSQVQNPKTGLWVKRDKDTGKFMDNKMDGKPFKTRDGKAPKLQSLFDEVKEIKSANMLIPPNNAPIIILKMEEFLFNIKDTPSNSNKSKKKLRSIIKSKYILTSKNTNVNFKNIFIYLHYYLVLVFEHILHLFQKYYHLH